MNEVFGSLYADIYDLVYRNKNYDEECSIIRTLFDLYGDGCILSVLDLGCGTGNHALRLAAQGYRVAGVDRSDEMLDTARVKAEGKNLPVALYHGDIKSVTINQTFDAVILMFAVLGYQVTNDDLIQTLRNIRRHIRMGGLLIFDVWYGPAVLSQKPGERVNVVEGEDTTIIRLSSGVLDTLRHVCNVHFKVYKIERRRLVDEATEMHQMRFFFPQEIAFFLEIAGFEMVHMGPFPEYKGELDEITWNALVVARGV
jgi:SAM-dependent methyltransferase